MNRKIERTDAEAAFIRTYLAANQTLMRGTRATLPLSALQAFLLVAGAEGHTVGWYAKEAGVPLTTMSRHLLDLGPRLRDHSTGAGLIERRRNNENLRETLYVLTHKGRSLIDQITHQKSWFL